MRILFQFLTFIFLTSSLSLASNIDTEREKVFSKFATLTKPLDKRGDLQGHLLPETENPVIQIISNDTYNDGSDTFAHIFAAKENIPQIHVTNLWEPEKRAQAMHLLIDQLRETGHVSVMTGKGPSLGKGNDEDIERAKKEFYEQNKAWPPAFGEPFAKNPEMKNVTLKTTKAEYPGFYQGQLDGFEEVFPGKLKNYKSIDYLEGIKKTVEKNPNALFDLFLLSPFHGIPEFLKEYKDKVRSVIVQGGPLSQPFPENVTWGYNTILAPEVTKDVFDTLKEEKIPTLIVTSYACDQCLMPMNDLDSFLSENAQLTELGKAVRNSYLYWNLHMSVKRGKTHKDNKLSDAVTMAIPQYSQYIGKVIRGNVKVNPDVNVHMLNPAAKDYFTSEENDKGDFFFVNSILQPEKLYQKINDRLQQVLFTSS